MPFILTTSTVYSFSSENAALSPIFFPTELTDATCKHCTPGIKTSPTVFPCFYSQSTHHSVDHPKHLLQVDNSNNMLHHPSNECFPSVIGHCNRIPSPLTLLPGGFSTISTFSLHNAHEIPELTSSTHVRLQDRPIDGVGIS